jgi:hypothetical protein
VAASWQSFSVPVEALALRLDDLVPELARVREAGLEPLDLEPRVSSLTFLTSLGVVRTQIGADTSLSRATACCHVVRQAVGRLGNIEVEDAPSQPSYTTQVQMLFRTHTDTDAMSVAEARTEVQECSGVEDRQYRARHEPRLLRLLAQAVLDLEREHKGQSGRPKLPRSDGEIIAAAEELLTEKNYDDPTIGIILDIISSGRSANWLWLVHMRNYFRLRSDLQGLVAHLQEVIEPDQLQPAMVALRRRLRPLIGDSPSLHPPTHYVGDLRETVWQKALFPKLDTVINEKLENAFLDLLYEILSRFPGSDGCLWLKKLLHPEFVEDGDSMLTLSQQVVQPRDPDKADAAWQEFLASCPAELGDKAHEQAWCMHSLLRLCKAASEMSEKILIGGFRMLLPATRGSG